MSSHRRAAARRAAREQRHRDHDDDDLYRLLGVREEQIIGDGAVCSLLVCGRPLALSRREDGPTLSFDCGGGHILYACAEHALALAEHVGIEPPWLRGDRRR